MIGGVKAAVTGAALVASQMAYAQAEPAAAESTATDATPAAADNGGVEDIVVTAQRRSESIQDIGIAVTAYGAEQIRDLGFTSSGDLISMVPGASMSNTSGGQYLQFSIRGVTQDDFANHTEAPNAVYLDDVYIASPQAQSFGLFDIQRVEVLRGPQGTLFGRNATGGLVHYITKDPTDVLDGFADLTYGRFNHVRLEGAIGGPIAPNLSARIAILREKQDSYIKNIFPTGRINNPVTGAPMGPSGDVDDLRDKDQTALRGKLRWDNGTSSLLLSGAWSRESRNVGDNQNLPSAAVLDANGRHVNSVKPENNPNRCEAISAETGACVPISFVDFEVPAGTPGFPVGVFPDEDSVRPDQFGDLLGATDPSNGGKRRLISNDHSPGEGNRTKVYGGFYRFSHDFDFATLIAQGSYMRYYKRSTLDDGTAVPWTIINIEATHNVYSQELRLSGKSDRLKWSAGAFYLNIDADTAGALTWPGDSPITFMFGPLVTGTPGLAWDSPAYADMETHSYSAFGQIDWEFADRFTVLLGGRIVRENKEFHSENLLLRNDNLNRIDPRSNLIPAPVFPASPFGVYPAFDGEIKKTLWMGKAQLEFRPNRDVLLFGGVSRGVKAGGFNSKLNDFSPPLDPARIPYKEETLISYEVGGKFDLAGGKLRLNSSIFYYDYQDYQAFQFTGIGGLIENADATYYGGELEIAARPFPQLDLSLNGSYIDATIKDIQIAPGIRRDVRPSYTPKYSIAGLVRYRLGTEIAGGEVALQLDGTIKGSSYSNTRNFEAERLEGYGQLNGSISWAKLDNGMTLTGFVKNIFDKRYEQSVVDISTLCGCSEIHYSDPRTWGIKLYMPIR
jgi:iron complex outermembrane receptor protein